LRLAAIVLAAGRSSRMGANKLLLEVGDRRVIEHILLSLNHFETIVVVGHRPDDVKELVEAFGAKTVHNPDYDGGMTTSFQAGLSSLDPEVEAVFMVLSDTFGFGHELLLEMKGVLMNDLEALIVSPVHEGRRGHPVLFRKPLFDEFLGLGEGETMRDVVNRHESQHRYIEAGIWCTVDLDTPEDYEQVKRLWRETRG
jgi:molybdenum cofactor cytidylyltransferase